MSAFDTDDESTISSFDAITGEDDENKSQESEESENIEDPTMSIYTTPIPKKKTEKKTYIRQPLDGEMDMRKSLKIMTQFEYAKLIGFLAEFFSNNNPLHPKYENVETSDMLEIAKMHLDDTDIPIPCQIYRPIDNPTPDAKVWEVFNARELMLPQQILTQYIDKYLPKSEWTVRNQI